jgi:hypothetical protein
MTWIDFFVNAAKFAPLATAVIAAIAAAIALTAVYVQRDIARRRAAIDFFLKTETDKELVQLYYRVKKMDVPALCSMPIAELRQAKEYTDARMFLNICELIAVGVRHGAFSDRVSYAYWRDVLSYSYGQMQPLIEHIRTTKDEGSPNTYIDLQKLCETWQTRKTLW